MQAAAGMRRASAAAGTPHRSMSESAWSSTVGGSSSDASTCRAVGRLAGAVVSSHDTSAAACAAQHSTGSRLISSIAGRMQLSTQLACKSAACARSACKKRQRQCCSACTRSPGNASMADQYAIGELHDLHPHFQQTSNPCRQVCPRRSRHCASSREFNSAPSTSDQLNTGLPRRGPQSDSGVPGGGLPGSRGAAPRAGGGP